MRGSSQKDDVRAVSQTVVCHSAVAVYMLSVHPSSGRVTRRWEEGEAADVSGILIPNAVRRSFFYVGWPAGRSVGLPVSRQSGTLHTYERACEVLHKTIDGARCGRLAALMLLRMGGRSPSVGYCGSQSFAEKAGGNSSREAIVVSREESWVGLGFSAVFFWLIRAFVSARKNYRQKVDKNPEISQGRGGG